MPSKEDNESLLSSEQEDFRAAMRYWATGVAVVSTHYKEVRHGMTV
ncbi:MAG: hypothetical protein IIC79_01885, partial [Chloroflexi bacterium]|nr:hypothetical protein [Chloroflexota bacterium]